MARQLGYLNQYRSDGRWHPYNNTDTKPPTTSWSGNLVYGANDSHFDALNAQFTTGHKLHMRRFYEGTWPSAPTNKETSDFARDVIPYVSFSGPSPDTINSGSHDAVLESYFGKSSDKKLISYIHEIDNGPKYDVAKWKLACQRIHTIKEANCPFPKEVLVGPTLMGWAFTQAGALNFMDYMHAPYMDFIGSDPYRFWRPPFSPDLSTPSAPDPKTGTLGTKRTMAYLFNGADDGVKVIPYAASLGIPLAVGEYAAHPDPASITDRAAWLNETDAFFRANNFVAACYFHGPWGESGPWYLDRYHTFTPNEGDAARSEGGADPNSLAAYQAFL